MWRTQIKQINQNDDFMSLSQWWVLGKTEIKEFCQQCTVIVSSAKSLRDLETDIVELEVSANFTGNRVWFENLKSKKALLGSGARGAQVCCRFQNLSLMDAPTKVFFSLEKRKDRARSDLCDDVMEVFEESFTEGSETSELQESSSNAVTKER